MRLFYGLMKIEYCALQVCIKIHINLFPNRSNRPRQTVNIEPACSSTAKSASTDKKTSFMNIASVRYGDMQYFYYQNTKEHSKLILF